MKNNLTIIFLYDIIFSMKKDKKDIFDPEFNNNEKPSLNSNDFTPASSNNKDNFAM